MTQGLSWILSGVEEVYNWASHLLSNPSLSSLILTRPQKSPISFGFFEKDSSPGSDGTTQEGARQLGCISRRNNQKPPAPLLPQGDGSTFPPR